MSEEAGRRTVEAAGREMDRLSSSRNHDLAAGALLVACLAVVMGACSPSSPSGQLLGVDEAGRYLLIDVPSGESVRLPIRPDGDASMSRLGDIAYTDAGSLVVWSSAEEAETLRVADSFAGGVTWSPDGTAIAVIRLADIRGGETDALVVVDARSGRPLNEVNLDPAFFWSEPDWASSRIGIMRTPLLGGAPELVSFQADGSSPPRTMYAWSAGSVGGFALLADDAALVQVGPVPVDADCSSPGAYGVAAIGDPANSALTRNPEGATALYPFSSPDSGVFGFVETPPENLDPRTCRPQVAEEWKTVLFQGGDGEGLPLSLGYIYPLDFAPDR